MGRGVRSAHKKRHVGVSMQLCIAKSLQLSVTDDCGGACAFLPAGVHLSSSISSSGHARADDAHGAVTLRALWTAAGPRRFHAALTHTTLSVADRTAEDGENKAVGSPRHCLMTIGSWALGVNCNSRDGAGGGGGTQQCHDHPFVE